MVQLMQDEAMALLKIYSRQGVPTIYPLLLEEKRLIRLSIRGHTTTDERFFNFLDYRLTDIGIEIVEFLEDREPFAYEPGIPLKLNEDLQLKFDRRQRVPDWLLRIGCKHSEKKGWVVGSIEHECFVQVGQYCPHCDKTFPSEFSELLPTKFHWNPARYTRVLEERVASRMLGVIEELVGDTKPPNMFLVQGLFDEEPYAVPPERVEGIFEAIRDRFQASRDWSILDDVEKDRDKWLDRYTELDRAVCGMIGKSEERFLRLERILKDDGTPVMVFKCLSCGAMSELKDLPVKHQVGCYYLMWKPIGAREGEK